MHSTLTGTDARRTVLVGTRLALAAAVSLGALIQPAKAQFFDASSRQQQSASQKSRADFEAARMQTKTANGRVSAQAYQNALQDAALRRQRMRPANFGRATGRAANLGYTQAIWNFLGPVNFRPGYVPNQGSTAASYVSGRANGVAYDNTTPGVVYLASASGGLWKSLNDGVSWLPLGDKFFYLQTSSVATDPTNGRIVYVGLGDYSGTSGDARKPGFSNASSLGMLKSVNGGNTFFYIAPELRGQAVSGIVVDPVDPRILTVTTGRGTVAGGIWRSTDSGATWTQMASAPGGDWSSIQCFNPYRRTYFPGNAAVAADPGRTRPYYATRIGDGVYRSTDQGATWLKINAPMRFNVPGSPGELALLAAPSSVDPNVVFVLDAGSAFQDGRIYVGRLSSGTTYTWIEITGSYGAGGNWSQNGFASLLSTAPVTANINSVLTASDLLYGGTQSLSAAIRGVNQVVQGFPDRIWSDLTASSGNSAVLHAGQQSLAFKPSAPSEQLLVNDGGVYGVNYNGATWSFSREINGTLGITQINAGDFHPTNANIMLGGTQALGLARSVNNTSVWRGAGGMGDFAGGNRAIGDFVGNVAVARDTPGRQYAWVIGGAANQGWATLRLAMTTNNWTSAQDISPNQTAQGPTGPVYAFPFTGDTDSTVATAWNGQTKPFSPILFSDSFGTDTAAAGTFPLYTGTTILWRYDHAPASRPDASTPPKIGTLGWWRPVGTQAFGGGISAVATAIEPLDNNRPGGRIFVGTATGEVWMSNNGRLAPDPANGDITATFTQINVGTGLPALPITSISVNPGNPSDILVTLGGTGTGTGHVYRCQNVLAGTRLFTDQSGLETNTGSNLFFTRLPDVQVNGLTRDTSDPINTWYIATDIGVFATSDQGSTWADASGPLGLPNVEVTSIKYVPATGFLNVATYGRGFWRIAPTTVENREQPNLKMSYTLSRSGTAIFAVITLRNDTNPSQIVGAAQDVQILAPTNLTVGPTATSTTTALPIRLGAIGVGSRKSVTLRFPGSLGVTGVSALLNVTARFSKAPTTDGTVQTSTLTFSERTRLP